MLIFGGLSQLKVPGMTPNLAMLASHDITPLLKKAMLWRTLVTPLYS